jgi:hypothetical protein
MKTLSKILGEDMGSPVANSMEAEDRPTRQMLNPRGVPPLDHKKLVPGVTDQEDIFTAANLKRSVPNPADNNTHGHTPAPKDELQYEEMTFEQMLDEATKKKKGKGKDKKPPFKEVRPFDDYQLIHMAQHMVNTGVDGADAARIISAYRARFPGND